MTLFIAAAAGLTLLALAFVLPPLLRKTSREASAASAISNLEVHRDALAALEHERAEGNLDDDQYRQEREEIGRRLLEESDDAGEGAEKNATTASTGLASSKMTAWILILALPIAAAGLYLALGEPRALNPQSMEENEAMSAAHAPSNAQIEDMVNKLAERLKKEPGSPEQWVMLARSYAFMERFAESAEAYGRAIELTPKGDRVLPDLLADYADILAVAQGGTLAGKPEQLISRALKLAPDNEKALALAGSAAFERGDMKQAIAHWQRLVKTADPASPLSQSAQAGIAEAEQMLGKKK